jgi:hypothetical protein
VNLKNQRQIAQLFDFIGCHRGSPVSKYSLPGDGVTRDGKAHLNRRGSKSLFLPHVTVATLNCDKQLGKKKFSATLFFVDQLEFQPSMRSFREIVSGWNFPQRLTQLESMGAVVEGAGRGSTNSEWWVQFRVDVIPIWRHESQVVEKTKASDEQYGF